MVNPSMYRCATTARRAAVRTRGHCNPDYDAIMGMIRRAEPVLPFALETESAHSLAARLTAGTLHLGGARQGLPLPDRADQRRGPRRTGGAFAEHARRRRGQGARPRAAQGRVRGGPLHGLPVLLDDSIDVGGLATTGGSIALQDSPPRRDSTIVAKLKAAGAVVIGKTNVTELGGLFDANLPEGYSSLGGQVLLPSDTDKTPAGSSGGSAAATASGLAALTVGMETSPDTAQLIAPAGVAGVVGLKPTVGLVSRTGVMPVARSQDSPGPIGRTVYDVATGLDMIAGADPADAATVGTPVGADYVAGLSTTALQGKRIAVIASTAEPYQAMVSALQAQGATTVEVTIAAASPDPASIVASGLAVVRTSTLRNGSDSWRAGR